MTFTDPSGNEMAVTEGTESWVASPAADQAIRASIIIVNYNGGEKLTHCLQSLSSHLEPKSEVILVDNASGDGSVDAIETRFPAVKLIHAGANLGFGAGNNLGVKHASGEYIVFLNPDTLVEDHWLKGLLAPIEEGKDVGLVTAKIVMAEDPNIINTCGNQVHLTGLTLCRGIKAPRQSLNQSEEVAAVSGAAFAIRHELFEQLGGFDEDTFLYVEDTDLSWRARLAGWKCVYNPESVILHHYVLKLTPLKIFYQERNRQLMLLKNLRWATLLVLLPALLLAEIISWSFVLLLDRANIANKVKAYAWICANWNAIMRKRKQVQALRTISDRKILRSMAIRLDFGQAAPPLIAALAHVVFDPLFLMIKVLALAVVWW